MLKDEFSDLIEKIFEGQVFPEHYPLCLSILGSLKGEKQMAVSRSGYITMAVKWFGCYGCRAAYWLRKAVFRATSCSFEEVKI